MKINHLRVVPSSTKEGAYAIECTKERFPSDWKHLITLDTKEKCEEWIAAYDVLRHSIEVFKRKYNVKGDYKLL